MDRYDDSSDSGQKRRNDCDGSKTEDITGLEPESYGSVLKTFVRTPATLVSIALVTIATSIHAEVVVPWWVTLLADLVWLRVLVMTGTGLLLATGAGFILARFTNRDPVAMYPNLHFHQHHYVHPGRAAVLKKSAFRHTIFRFALAVVIAGYVTPALLWAGWIPLSVP